MGWIGSWLKSRIGTAAFVLERSLVVMFWMFLIIDGSRPSTMTFSSDLFVMVGVLLFLFSSSKLSMELITDICTILSEGEFTVSEKIF